MRLKAIAAKYGIEDYDDFYRFMKVEQQEIKLGSAIFEDAIADADAERAVLLYSDYREERRKEEQNILEEEQNILEEERSRQRAISKILISSGFSFDGYKIVKYSGYISGDDCVTLPRDNFWGTNKVDENLCGALVKIRRQALKELKEAAYDLGCNAVIGVDFDYLTMDPQHAAALNAAVTVYEPYVICVTANGNAVVIEKIDDET